MATNYRCKTVQYQSGSEEGYEWQLKANICLHSHIFTGSFSLATDEKMRKLGIRRKDRYWAKTTFPRQWLKQFEIHHDWSGGEVIYFLTKEEHKRRHKK